jgi:large subunit ribosomal protein L5
MPRLKDYYKETVVPYLMERFKYKSVMAVPKIEKVIINMGVGDAIQNQDLLKAALNDLTLISGQKPIVTKAKKSISNFKLRKGMSIGCKVTLRGNRMWEFLDKLLNVSLFRIRDFRGVSSKSFDGKGNYSLGLKEQLIFPEIEYDKVVKVRGMDITIVTTANTDEEAYELLKSLGMPFRS